MNILTCQSILVAWSIATCAAHADEAALYDKAAPSDAVFVRVLSEPSPATPSITFGGKSIPMAEFASNTYLAISAAELTDVAAGAYYSLAFNQTGPQMIKEPSRETAAKVHLFLVNTGTSEVRLVVPGKGIEVIAPLKAGEAASRAVNPISTELSVERIRDGVTLATFDVSLSRGQNLSFVASDDTAKLVENEFGPVLTSN